LVWTGYYYRTVSIVAEAARLLGKTEDAQHYAALADNIKEAFNKKWLNTDANMYTDPTVRGFQTCNFLPLALGIVPDKHREGVLNNVVKDIVEQRDGFLQTGNTGTTCLVDTLTRAGYGEVMYNLTNRIRYPGWGWSTAQGATSSWESWSGARKSMMLINPINEFFYNDLAGIQGPDYHGPGYITPGFREINIKPYPLGDLTHASASVRTVRGMISSSWIKTDETFDLEVEIPVNSKAKVSVPKLGNRNVTVSESATPVWDENAFVEGNPGVTGGSEDEAYVTFDVGSGSYRFQLSAEE
jgi:alpha-L-rhamnosidase